MQFVFKSTIEIILVELHELHFISTDLLFGFGTGILDYQLSVINIQSNMFSRV